MQQTALINRSAIAILGLAIVVAGCGSKPTSNTATSKKSTATSAAKSTPAAQPKVAPRNTVPGPSPIIADFIKQNGITETPVHRGDPGAPSIDLPIPDGWADAGHDTPANAYWAIVDTGPEAATYTPAFW